MNEDKQTFEELDVEFAAELDLFAEELPERLNTSGAALEGKWSCLFCYACAGGSASCVSSFCSAGAAE